MNTPTTTFYEFSALITCESQRELRQAILKLADDILKGRLEGESWNLRHSTEEK